MTQVLMFITKKHTKSINFRVFFKIINIDIYFLATLTVLFADTCFGLCGEIPGSTGDKFSLGLDPINSPRKRNRFAHMLQSADPGDDAFQAEAEAAMRHRAVFAQF